LLPSQFFWPAVQIGPCACKKVFRPANVRDTLLWVCILKYPASRPFWPENQSPLRWKRFLLSSCSMGSVILPFPVAFAHLYTICAQTNQQTPSLGWAINGTCCTLMIGMGFPPGSIVNTVVVVERE